MTETMTRLEMKHCSRCGKEKPFTEFYGCDRYYCISCERESARWRMGRYENKIRTAWRDAKKAAKRFGVEDTLTLDEVAYIFALSGGRDAYTGKYAENLSLEHVVSMSRNGPNAFWNVVAVDTRINKRKNNDDPYDWLEMHGLYDVENDLTALMAARKGISLAEMQNELSEAQRAYNTELYRKFFGKKAVASG